MLVHDIEEGHFIEIGRVLFSMDICRPGIHLFVNLNNENHKEIVNDILLNRGYSPFNFAETVDLDIEWNEFRKDGNRMPILESILSANCIDNLQYV